MKMELDDTQIKSYLSEMGRREQEELRALYTAISTTPQTRQQALIAQDNLILFLNGFFYCLELGIGVDAANYYRSFFDQARSQKGIDDVG